jgi:hypothetical protein
MRVNRQKLQSFWWAFHVERQMVHLVLADSRPGLVVC